MDSVDFFDLESLPLDLDPNPTNYTPSISRFTPKLKGKIKAEPSTIQESNELISNTATASSSCNDPMQEEEDDDPIVKEFDVFFNRFDDKDDDAQVYLLQFPLRPYWRPYELDERCEEVKLKPNCSEVEIISRIDVDSQNYNKDAPIRLLKQKLMSTKAIPSAFCVAGTIAGNELHLNPIQAVLQFRPSIKHMNDYVPELDKQQTSNEVCKLSNKEKLIRGCSSDEISDAEPWVSLKYNPIGSTYSRKYQQKMMARQLYNIDSTANRSEYLDSLCPQMPTIKTKEVPITSFMVSFPLEERLKGWFCQGSQVNSFNALTHFDSSESEENLLKIVERHACLVQGSWVAKSSFICEGHEAEIRDYILFLFNKNHVIKKTKLIELKTTDDTLKKLLIPLAYERPTLEDWKFREVRDTSFIKEHVQIVREQESIWSTRGQHLIEYFSKLGKTATSIGKNPPVSNMVKKKTAMQKGNSGAKRSHEESTSSMSNEQKESLKSALLQIFHDKKARSLGAIIRELRDLTLSKASRPKANSKIKTLSSAVAIAVSGSSPDFLSVLDDVTIRVHNTYYSRSGDNPELDPLRHVILGLFNSKKANAEVKKEEIKAAGKVLEREYSDEEYKKVVKELCQYKQQIAVLKGADNKE